MPHRHIRRILKKHIPEGVKQSKRIFSFKYPKIFFLLLAVVLAYYLFNIPNISAMVSNLNNDNYVEILLAGFFFSFGFSTPFSIGFFAVSQPTNLLLAAFIGGASAMVGDLVIFRLIKFSFLDEFNKLKKEGAVEKIRKIAGNHIPTLMKHYLLYIFAGIVIASPLPDEIGISMLAGLTTISQKKLALMSFLFNSLGIFIILSLL